MSVKGLILFCETNPVKGRLQIVFFFNLQYLLLASAQHLIFLRNCSSLWSGNKDQKPRGIVHYLDDGLWSAACYNNAKIARLQDHVQVFLRTNSNAFGNRPRSVCGLGPLSIRPLLVLPPPMNGP